MEKDGFTIDDELLSAPPWSDTDEDDDDDDDDDDDNNNDRMSNWVSDVVAERLQSAEDDDIDQEKSGWCRVGGGIGQTVAGA